MLYNDLVPKGQWLCHHGIKGQKWGVRRYQNPDGSLTEEGRRHYGLNNLDPSIRNYDPRKAKKAFKTELKQIRKNYRIAKSKMEDILDPIDEADRKLMADIEKATANKKFVSDWKKEVQKYFDAVNNRNENNEWLDWIDVIRNSIKTLKSKYPEFSDLIDGYSPEEYFHKNDDKELTRFMNSKEPIVDILNNDHYYEPDMSTYDRSLESLENAVNRELVDYFMAKYGRNIVKF